MKNPIIAALLDNLQKSDQCATCSQGEHLQFKGEATHANRRLSWRSMAGQAQLRMQFDKETNIEGLDEDSGHKVSKTSGWVKVPLKAMQMAIMLFNRIPMTEEELEAFRFYDFKDADLKIEVSQEVVGKEWADAQAIVDQIKAEADAVATTVH